MRKFAAALVFFLLVSIALTWPLAMQFSTHVAGDGIDDPALTWNLWWFKHAILDLLSSPLYSDFMFYPLGVNLVFYTLTLLNDALALPVYALAGLAPATNVMLLASFTLSGYGAFLLASHTIRRAGRLERPGEIMPTTRGYPAIAGAVIAGLIYSFSSNKMLYASLGQFNITSSQWIPFYLLYLLKLGEALEASATRRAVRNTLLAAAFLLLQAYAELTFASFLVVLTAIFAFWQLLRWRNAVRLAASLTLLSLTFAVGFGPVLLPMLLELRTEGDILVQGSGFAEAFSADLLGFLVPSKLNPLLGTLGTHFQFPYINFVFVGWLTLVLAVLGAWLYWRSAVVRFVSASTAIFAVIALGPGLRINGAEVFRPLPFALFQLLPIFNGNRYPSRYSVMITLGVALLAGLAVTYLVAKLGGAAAFQDRTGIARMALIRAALVGGVGLLILGEHLSPLPFSDVRAPAFYEEIRRDPGDFSVLELPLAWRNGFRVTGALDDNAGKAFMRAQLYQSVHEKRMLSGNTSRNPELQFQYFTEAPVINSIIALETGHDIDAATLAADQRLAPDVFAFFGIRYVVLRPEAGAKIGPYLLSVLPGLQAWRNESGVQVYRLAMSMPADTLRVDPVTPIARLFFGEGWGELGEKRAWAQRTATRLLLPMAADVYTLSLQLNSPVDGQTLSVEVNGHSSPRLNLSKGLHRYDITLDHAVIRPGVNSVYLRWQGLYAEEKIPFPQPSIVVKSAGEEVGDFARIWLNGLDRSPNQRGFNAVFFSANGVTVSAFDTFESTAEADRLSKALRAHPGEGIALAVRDEASRNLTSGAIAALRSLGTRANVNWRSSFAFLKLPTGGFIVENASPIRPVIVSSGERITAPNVAGAVESIGLRRAPDAP